MEECTIFDKKSLRTVIGKSANFDELAKDCVAFANSKGGFIHIGVEDDETLPPVDQKIERKIADMVVRKLNERTINVYVAAEVLKAQNGGEYINLKVFPSTSSIAATTKGAYFLRDDDQSRALHPDELSRLMNDKPSYCWETKVSLKYKLADCDIEKKRNLISDLRNSDRVSTFVKEKSDDEFINMYPDRMEVVNPGLLPMGVTPDNILQKQIKRNEHLARLCVALHLMEGEGSGYDLMYETLLTAGKERPVVVESSDSVKVVIYRKITNKEVAQLSDYVISNYPTTQKGRIALGLILNEKKVTAAEMSKLLQLQTGDKLENYIGKLIDEGIVSFNGRGKGTQYFISPMVVAYSRSNVVTSLKTIEPYRLKALIKEDLRFHPDSLWSEVAARLPDVDADELQRTIRKMAMEKEIVGSVSRKYRRYKLL